MEPAVGEAPSPLASLPISFFDRPGKVVIKLTARSEPGEAFRHTIRRQDALLRFLTDGRLEVDDGIAESAKHGGSRIEGPPKRGRGHP